MSRRTALLTTRRSHQPYRLMWLFSLSKSLSCWNFSCSLERRLHGELYVLSDNNRYKLQKGLYDLKQSLHLCTRRLKIISRPLITHSSSGASAYFKFKEDMHAVIIMVYVEDLVIVCPELSEVKSAKSSEKASIN